MEQLNAVSVTLERLDNMSIINKIMLIELFDNVHKTVSPLYIIEYDSNMIKSARDFASLPKQVKKIIKTNYHNDDYKRTLLNGTLNNHGLHIIKYERYKTT